MIDCYNGNCSNGPTETNEKRNIMSLLTATHLPLLEAKLLELKALHLTLSCSAPSDASEKLFSHHWDLSVGDAEKFDSVAYKSELKTLNATYQAAKDLNYRNIEDLSVAIVECTKHISINNALELIS